MAELSAREGGAGAKFQDCSEAAPWLGAVWEGAAVEAVAETRLPRQVGLRARVVMVVAMGCVCVMWRLRLQVGQRCAVQRRVAAGFLPGCCQCRGWPEG